MKYKENNPMLNKFMILIKETRLFITFLIGLATTATFDSKLMLDLVYTYNIHIMIFMFIMMYIFYFIVMKKIKETDEKTNSLFLEKERVKIRTEIHNVSLEYKENKVINSETTIRYLLDLNRRRKKLKVNSFSETALKDVLIQTVTFKDNPSGLDRIMDMKNEE